MNLMSANAQLIGFMLAIGVPCLTSLIGVLISNSRIGDTNNRIADTNSRIADLRAHFDSRFDAQDLLFTEKLRRVEEVMDARLTRIEDQLHLR
jgi:hypothetical protein